MIKKRCSEKMHHVERMFTITVNHPIELKKLFVMLRYHFNEDKTNRNDILYHNRK